MDFLILGDTIVSVGDNDKDIVTNTTEESINWLLVHFNARII